MTELPYMVNKARLIEKIADLHKDKKVDGITDLRDESNREGIRVCIELRKDVNPNIVLNHLYKHTQLQDTFGVIMLALVDNQPRILNIHEMLANYLKHQEEVVTRRTRYELNKAEERAHILEGLLIALANIDEVIRIIRNSKNTNEAKEKLIERFSLSDAQAQAIVDMRLRALTGLEREKIEQEHKELMIKIAELKEILGNRKVLLRVIKDEITVTAEKYGDDRRTVIGYDDDEISMEDLIPDDETVIAMTNLGYVKRMSVDNFKSQHRGGKGIRGMSTIDEDVITDLLMTTNHRSLLFFTNKGRVYRMKAYHIPEASRTARGTAIINLLELQPEEKISAVVPIKDFEPGQYLVMATKNGTVKKTPLMEYSNIRRNGIIAISLREDDELIEVKYTDGEREILLATKKGQSIRFHESEIRQTGRSAMGVKGMTLMKDDEVIGMQLDNQGTQMLFVTERGMGKQTLFTEFSPQHRGGKGVKCYRITEKTGDLVGAKAVNDDDEIMLITDGGVIIRMAVDGISVVGRITSGVKVMNLEEDVRLAGIAKVKDNAKDEETSEEEDAPQGEA